MIQIPRNARLLRWGPIDSIWMTLSYPAHIPMLLWKYYRMDWVDSYLLSNGSQWLWVGEMDNLEQKGWETFQQWMLVTEKQQEIRSNYEKQVQLMHSSSQRIFANEHLQWSNEELLEWFQEWSDAFIIFWAHATPPEFVTWGAEVAVRNAVKQYGQKKEQVEILEALTAPTQLSFYQQGLLDVLQRIAGATTDVQRANALQEHIEHYYWLDNSYAQARRRTSADAQQLVDHAISEYGTLKDAIETLKNFIAIVDEKRGRIQGQYGISDELMNWSRTLGNCISWQDERKGEQWRQHDVLFTMLKECERRFHLPFSTATWLYPNECIDHCRNGTDITAIVNCRKHGMVVKMDKETRQAQACGPAVQDDLQQYWERARTSDRLKGEVASFGKQEGVEISGRVTIVLSPQQTSHFEQGDILVACMTSPDYVGVMRKAKAIVTDEGGLTAHAAVISRELEIPCIVATKYATKVLKNGDQITLNVQTGTIEKNH